MRALVNVTMQLSFVLPPPASVPACLAIAVELGAFVVDDDDLEAVGGVRAASHDVSIRGVAFQPAADGGVALRLSNLVSPEDYGLAVAVASEVAERCAVRVGVGAGSFSASGLRQEFSMARCRVEAERVAASVLALIVDGGVRVEGVRRSLWLGAGLRDDLGASPGALIERARFAQWPGEPEPLVVRGELLASHVTVAELPLDRRTLLEPVDLVSLPVGLRCVVPRTALVDALGDRAIRLDERRWLLAPVSADRAEALHRSLRAHHVPVPARWQPIASARPLLPLLQPPGWLGRSTSLSWPIAQGPDGLLWVSLVRDDRSAIRLVGADTDEARDPSASFERAIEHLESQLGPWELDRNEEGHIVGLTLVHELASEAVLSTSRMLRAHELLGARALVAAVPVRGILRLQNAYPEDQHAVRALAEWAEIVYTDAGGQPTMSRLSPRLLVLVRGQVQGQLRTQGEERQIEEGSLEQTRRTPTTSDRLLTSAADLSAVIPHDPATGRSLVLASALVPGLGQWQASALGMAYLFVSVELTVLAALGVVRPPLWLAICAVVVVHASSALHARHLES